MGAVTDETSQKDGRSMAGKGHARDEHRIESYQGQEDYAPDRQGVLPKGGGTQSVAESEEEQFVLQSSGEEDADEIEWDKEASKEALR